MFYDRFIELCKKKGIKPTPLIVGMGLSSSNVSQWKKGSTPRPEVLKKLANYFEVSVEDLLDTEQKEKPATPKGDRQSDQLDSQFNEIWKGLTDDQKKLLIAQMIYLKQNQ